MDYNGYPDDNDLKEIENWPYDEPMGLIEHIQYLWKYDDYIKVTDSEIEIHTGGWSGNEEIILSLQRNLFWFFYWKRSERGGHYYFDLPKPK